jgi:integrase/recombinase XerD
MSKKNSLVLINHTLEQKFKEKAQARACVEDFINEFLGQFISPETKRAYMTDLGMFFSFIKSGGDNLLKPSDIKSYHFQLYRDHLMEIGHAGASINRRLVAIRSFVKWAIASKLMDVNPLDTVKLPKNQTENPTQAFDDKEVMQMISIADLTTHKGRVHRLTMVLLFNLGLRRSELVNIKIADVSNDRGHVVLKIKGKGSKIRLVPLNEFVQTEIESYLNSMNLSADDFMLQLSEKNISAQPIDGSTIYRMITSYAKKCGINKKVSPHSCRATVISHLLDTQRTPIRDVAIFAGHSQITTTERYDKRRQNLDKSAAYEVDFKKNIAS